MPSWGTQVEGYWLHEHCGGTWLSPVGGEGQC